MVGIAQAALTKIVTPPALETAVVQQRTVHVPRCELDRLLARAEIERRQAIAHLIRLIAAMVHVTQAELTDGVIPPTFDAAIVRLCTVACGSGMERDNRLAWPQVHC